MAAKFSISRLLGVALALTSSVFGGSLFAQTTWSGTTNNSWNTSTNWSSGVPASNANVILPVTNAGNRYSIQLPSPTNAIASLQAPATVSNNKYDLTNGTLALAANGTITNNRRTSTGNVGLSISTLSLSGSATISGTGVMNLNDIQSSVGATGVTISSGTVLLANASNDVSLITGSSAAVRYVNTSAGSATFQNGSNLLPSGDLGASASFTALTLETGATTTTRVGWADELTMPSDTISSSNTTLGGNLRLNFADVGANTWQSWTSTNIFLGTLSGSFSSVTLVNNVSPYNGLTFNKFGNEWVTGTFAGYNGEPQWLVFSETSGNLVVVPEPSTIVFAGVGVAMAGWSAWKKRRLSKVLAKS